MFGLPPSDDVGQECVVFREWRPQKGKTQELIDAFQPLLESASTHKDFCCLFLLREVKDPRNDEPDDGNGMLFTLASFQNKIAYQQFLISPAMLALKETCLSSSLLEPLATDHAVRSACGFACRDTNHFVPESFVVLATLHYKPGTRAQGVKCFREVAEYTKKEEPEAYSYWFLEDCEDEDRLYSFERYESHEFLWKTHAVSEAVKRNIVEQGEIRESLSFRFWRQVGGVCNSG